jgi:hypothetical protein
VTKSRNILPPRNAWSKAQLSVLRRLYADNPTKDVAAACGHTVSSTYQRANSLGLRKSAEYLASPAAGRLDGVRGAACRFVKGQQPWSKGTKGVVGVQPGCRRTQFKKGQMHGAAQHNYVPIGSERVTDGQLQRKVTDDPNVYPARRWVAVARLVWEEANGPIPPGHAVTFKAGRQTIERERITLDAIELVSRAELMRRNTIHVRYPPEVVDVIRLAGALKRKIRNRSKAA